MYFVGLRRSHNNCKVYFYANFFGKFHIESLVQIVQAIFLIVNILETSKYRGVQNDFLGGNK